VKPQRLRNPADIADIKESLLRFYTTRPPIYDMEERREQAIYEEYSDLVAKYSKPGGRVLDFGSGTYRLPMTIHARGLEVTSCDFYTDEMLRLADERLPKKGVRLIPLRQSPLPLPLDNNSFDTVTSLTVMEHIIDVGKTLSEFDRILAPGGIMIIRGPNWSGPNVPVRAFQSLLVRHRRFWQYETLADAVTGLARAGVWYAEILLSREPRFLLIYPRMRDGEIDFRSSDDDAVHLNHPLSYKKWFRQMGYQILRYNHWEGDTKFAKIFNAVFPSLATTNTIIARKPNSEV
jgi:ubiquinone/menaquinone biosynthesis C-methylase UbiE